MRRVQTKQIKDLTLIALLSAILFVQQLALSMLPNIQFTTLLIVLYTKVLGFKKTTLIIFIHVIISNFFSPYGTVNPMFLPSMFIAWMLIPISLNTIFKKVDSAFTLAFIGFVFGFIYGWTFIPISVYILDAPLKAYFLMDLPFEIIMAISNFLTILWLYDPLKKVLEHQKEKYYQLIS
jgi:energy-coupling factor transport system substrate-specific component